MGPAVVTVVVLNYNYARFAVECLESVRAQSYEHIKLVVIDDGSTDGSREIIADWVAEHWPSATCRLHHQNRGLLARCREALSLVPGPYYQVFSTDDTMVPEKIATQVAALEANPRAALCYSDMWYVDEAGVGLPDTAMHDPRAAGHPPRSGRVLDLVFAGGGFPTATWLLRRDAVLAVGGYEPRIYTEDMPLLFRLAARFEFEYVDRQLVLYRWHGANLSARFESTPEHRLAWCELLREIEDEPGITEVWLQEYRRRVRNLIVGNSRREALPHVRHLARRDPSARNLTLLGMTAVGLCGSRARQLMAARDSVRRALR